MNESALSNLEIHQKSFNLQRKQKVWEQMQQGKNQSFALFDLPFPHSATAQYQGKHSWHIITSTLENEAY